MIRPKTGCVLVRLIKETESKGGIAFADHTVTPEEQQQLNHSPKPPPPILGRIVAIGPWPRLANGLAVLPPFPAGATVLMRPGSGVDLKYGTNDKLKLVKSEDLLAVLNNDP